MWDTKYRPKTFGDVLGQSGSVDVLRARIIKGQAGETSYIFSGGHGCGKTTLARILAKGILCLHPTSDGDPCNECDHCKGCDTETLEGFMELDAASHGTTADMREVMDSLSYPLPGIPRRVFLIDEAHRMSRDGQDVLLKGIEEKRLVVIFCTTELAKIRGTIKSRCESYEVLKSSRDDIYNRVLEILSKEGVTSFEPEAVYSVIDLCKLHIRDVLKKLETLAHVEGITLDAVQSRFGLAGYSAYLNVVGLILRGQVEGNIPAALSQVEELCDQYGASDVVAGLSEAAMLVVKREHGLKITVSKDEEKLANDLAGCGVLLTQVAEFLMSRPYTTKQHLLCDVLTLALAGGRLKESGSGSVVNVVLAPVVAPTITPAAPVASTPVEAVEVKPPTQTIPPPAPTTVSRPSTPPEVDPDSLHSGDKLGVSATLPRYNKMGSSSSTDRGLRFGSSNIGIVKK